MKLRAMHIGFKSYMRFWADSPAKIFYQMGINVNIIAGAKVGKGAKSGLNDFWTVR